MHILFLKTSLCFASSSRRPRGCGQTPDEVRWASRLGSFQLLFYYRCKVCSIWPMSLCFVSSSHSRLRCILYNAQDIHGSMQRTMSIRSQLYVLVHMPQANSLYAGTTDRRDGWNTFCCLCLLLPSLSPQSAQSEGWGCPAPMRSCVCLVRGGGH